MTGTRQDGAARKRKSIRRLIHGSCLKFDAQVTPNAIINRNADFEDDETPVELAIKIKRGAKPKHRPDLYSFRDSLVMMLENHWPEIAEVRHSEVSAEMRMRRLRSIQKLIGGNEIRHLIEHADALTAFIDTNRGANDPRAIANALAGVPGIGIWTSLRKCQRAPCESAIGLRALRAYIERKHKRLAERLSTVRPGDVLGYKAALRDYDLRDRNIARCKSDFRFCMEVWETGLSRYRY